jgi:hypothetical protein
LAGLVAIAAGVIAAIAAAGSVLLLSTPDSEVASAPDPTAVPTVAVEQAIDLATDVCSPTFDVAGRPSVRVFDPFYTTQREVLGITIVAGPEVDSAAIDIAEVTIRRMFEGNDREDALVEAGAYIVVAEPDQGVLDLPEFSCLEDQLGTRFFTHVCGIADRAENPVATVNALDLLGSRRGPCDGVNILYHEIGHLVHGWSVDPPDYIETRWLYDAAMKAGLYDGLYASTNFREYFAEGTQAYFDAQDREGTRNRTWLEHHDPELYELIRRVYGE